MYELLPHSATAERAAKIQGNGMMRVFEMYKFFNQKNSIVKKLYHTEGLRFYNKLSRHFNE